MSRVLLLIVIAELMGSSVWFSTNAVASQLLTLWSLNAADVGLLTNAVQYGFIAGTLFFALSGLADRYHASRIFFVCALIAAFSNLGFAWLSEGLNSAWWWRLLTGFSLAGVYPLGMKLVVSWEPEKKGFALGWLTGMLVLGTALPHLVRALGAELPWQWVVGVSSLMAFVAAFIVLSVGDGPHEKATGKLDWGGVLRAFKQPEFRAAACGYFGHMWELYALWTLAPLIFLLWIDSTGQAWGFTPAHASLLSFLFIGAGSLGCVLGGYASRKMGSGPIAFAALATSGLCCVMFPLLWPVAGLGLLLVLLIWGISVAGDSPQFSALASHFAPTGATGSALAVMNGIGFFITTLSIQLCTSLWNEWQYQVLWLLIPGPLLGLWSMRRVAKQ
jgi:MFS family permease